MESERWVRSGQVCLKNFYIFCIFFVLCGGGGSGDIFFKQK